MKVVILAGGLGTRISELTKIVPKPMIKIYRQTYYSQNNRSLRG